MDIIIPDSWLREFLKTKATPEQIAKYLSGAGPSVERVEKQKRDFLYRIEITSNRPDAFSIFGIAKEAAAILPRYGIRAKLTPPKGTSLDLISEIAFAKILKVKIIKESLCPRFSAIILSGVKIEKSPKIIADRLIKIGVNPINNVVDITNYLMYELGQPMHSFDFDKIKNGKIMLRESREGEEIVTLDGNKRKLPAGTIVIEDEKRLIDLCGIMGGKNSEVEDNTTNVLLFVQTYDPIRIRKTSQAIKFRTEASQRFEKGLDQEGVMPALKRATYLLKQHSGAKISSELIDIYNKKSPKYIILSFATLFRILGKNIPAAEVVKILKSLGFKITNKNNKQLTCLIPSERLDDINIEEDLVEEVARIYGYSNLEGILPTGQPPNQNQNPIFEIEKQIKYFLKHLGFFEVYTNSLISKQNLVNFGLDPQKQLKVNNPLTLDNEYLRPTILPSLVEVVEKNQAANPKLSIFEIANVYIPKTKGLPNEQSNLCLLQIGKDYFETKGIVEALFEELKMDKIKFIANVDNIFINSAKIHYKDDLLGYFGQFNFAKNIFNFAQINIEKLSKNANIQKPFKSFSKYPQTFIDIAIVIDKGKPVSSLETALLSRQISNLKQVKLIDVFENHKLGENVKSVTLRLTLGSNDHTLSQKEIYKAKKQAIDLLTKQFFARLR